MNNEMEVTLAIELWFFRDLSDEQRRSLIRLTLGQGCADEAANHGLQRLCLKRITTALAETQPERNNHEL